MENYLLNKFLVDNYSDYGRMVNLHRAVPGLDGLKPSYRRALSAIREIATGKLVATTNALGATIVKHPFSPASVEAIIADLVRQGELMGQGAFGIKLIENIPAAAPRYTQVGMDRKKADYYFKLVDYCNIIEGEVDMEPEYFITPVPYCLIYGALNWGLGVSCRTPAFTYQSIIEAYANNDPSKLVSNYGYVLDYENSDLQGLWDTGIGKLTIKYHINKVSDSEFLLYGSGELFTPLLTMFNKYINEGSVVITNESTNEVVLRVSRAYRSRVNMKDVYAICERACTKSRLYRIMVVKDNKVVTIGMKEWLDITIGKYIESYNKFKADRISRLNTELEVLTVLPSVGKLILEDYSDNDILEKLNISQDILDRVKRRSISTLRKSDFTSEIKSIDKSIKDIESEDPAMEILKYGD